VCHHHSTPDFRLHLNLDFVVDYLQNKNPHKQKKYVFMVVTNQVVCDKNFVNVAGIVVVLVLDRRRPLGHCYFVD
jgi:hypothetical protein